jgi:hypothetical protein
MVKIITNGNLRSVDTAYGIRRTLKSQRKVIEGLRWLKSSTELILVLLSVLNAHMEAVEGVWCLSVRKGRVSSSIIVNSSSK